MECNNMKNALAIISQADPLSITREDKSLIIHTFSTIMAALNKVGMLTTEMSFQHALLREATWNDGYFCTVAKRMCSIMYPVLETCEAVFNVKED